jgi:type I restriction enzyme S subunit
MPEFRVIAASKATTMGHIKRVHLDQAKVVAPPSPVVDVAREVFDPIYDLLKNVAVESRKLAEIRDYLLPKLLSGEVRVKETEAAVAEAV